MSKEQDNKAIVGRWFDGFWGNPWNPDVIDEPHPACSCGIRCMSHAVVVTTSELS